MATDNTCIIRKAKPEDCEEILSLTKEMAETSNIAISLDAETMRKDGFGAEPMFHCLVAVDVHQSTTDQTVQSKDTDNDKVDSVDTKSPTPHTKRTRDLNLVGYVIYLFYYAGYEGPYVFLESIHVLPEYKARGVDIQLAKEVARVALRMGCSNLHWIREKWQGELSGFVHPNGAIIPTVSKDILCFQLFEEELKTVAQRKGDIKDGILIRKARPEDCEDIISLMKDLAVHERSTANVIQLDAGTLRKDGFDGHPMFHCYVAEDQSAGGKLIGYTLSVLHYSPIDGVSIFLEDMYVSSGYRKHGVGSRLFQEVAREAKHRGCKRIHWLCSSWNKGAIHFYESKGAINFTQTRGTTHFRLSDDNLKYFACE